LLKSASNPSPRCNPDRRLFFELTGHTTKEVSGNYVIINVNEGS